MITPYQHTNHLLNKFGNNELASPEEALDATTEVKTKAADAEKQQYIHQVAEFLGKATPDTSEKIAWQLASHSQRQKVLAKDFLCKLKIMQRWFTKNPSLASEKSRKTIEDLIAKADQITKNPTTLSTPFISDIWRVIICGNKILKHDFFKLRGISKKFNTFLKDILIFDINNNHASFPDRGFYSIDHISGFFGIDISNLKQISFVTQDRETEVMQSEYLFNQYKMDRKWEQFPPPPKGFSYVDPGITQKRGRYYIETAKPEAQQKKFNELIKSLKEIESFHIRDCMHSSTQDRFSAVVVPTEQRIKLDSLVLQDFCRNNPKLKKLKIENLKHITLSELEKSVNFLECLEEFCLNVIKEKKISKLRFNPRSIFDHESSILNNINLHSIKKLKYYINNQKDIDALKHFKKLEKVNIFLSSYLIESFFCSKEKTTVDQIIKNLAECKIQELSIKTQNAESTQYITLLPPDLKKLVIKNASIDLESFFISASKCPDLTELQLKSCILHDENNRAATALQQCRKLETVIIIDEAACTKDLIEQLRKSNPEKNILKK
jgi:hypothetical protein